MILVTGATGTIGSEVVKHLSAANVKVRALVRTPAKAESLKGPNVELVQGDFDNPASLDAALKGVDTLFMLTAGDPKQVELQRNAIQAAQRAGVKRVVKLSAMGADVNAPVALGRWHGQTEKELKESGLAWTILQPGYFMQNMMMSLQSIKVQGVFYGAMKEGKVSMIDARDIALVSAKVLTSPGHEGKTYLLTGPEAITMSEAAAKLSAAINKPVKYVDLAPDQLKQGIASAGVPEWLAGDLVAMNIGFSNGWGAATSSAVQDVTGKPPRPFDAFARDFAGAFK